MSPLAKNKTVGSNAKIENTGVDLNTLNYPEEIINTYHKNNESELESDISTGISD